ncbi:hypothetical protein ACA910_014920 [Epithemia clementina (nom. ined.)]
MIDQRPLRRFVFVECLLVIISPIILVDSFQPAPQITYSIYPSTAAKITYNNHHKRSTIRPRSAAAASDREDDEDRPDNDQISNFNVNGDSSPIVTTNGAKMGWNGYADHSRYSTMLDEPAFSRFFTPRPLQVAAPSTAAPSKIAVVKDEDDEDEDGWKDMRKRQKWWSFITKRVSNLVSGVRNVAGAPRQPTEPGTLILVRHGESTWNANKTFTGWSDYADLSERGTREVEHAARLLLEGGYDIDVVFTSRLQRAIRSVWIILQELNQVYLPVFKSWRLNERMYGALTGLSKINTAEQLGHDMVQKWRNSLYARPPALTPSDQHWPGRERKYADLRPEQIPLTESLSDCMKRTIPLWETKILYELRNGRNVMVVGHANTLRGLVKTIDNISDEDIQDVAIPTGIPIIYKFDHNLQSIRPPGDRQTACQVHMNGLFLEEPGLLKQALAREEEWSKSVPGYNPTMKRSKTPMSSLERSLYKLQAERELNKWAEQFFDRDAEAEDDGTDGNNGLPIRLNGARADELKLNGGSGGSSSIQTTSDKEPDVVANLLTPRCASYMPEPSANGERAFPPAPIRTDAVIVIIRHGKTEHNKLGLFTGWEDAPLAKDGVLEAQEAGRLLKAHGFEFDVVYTSWLSRAIETAWEVLDQMDCLWLPIVKTWRLNERMYGQLTGLSKQMVKQRHGEKQFKAWRRGYDTPPPKVSSFSQHYPGNDLRYQKYVSDVRYSLRETVIRSIESGRPTPSRKLPKTESLKDCMDRTIPFFTEKIVPEAIEQGKRVLISSSENAIRGLLMHLCQIPQEKITGLEIPNGLPLIFDPRSKCVKLLDDGSGRDPLEKYNFGSAAKYLFRPCQNVDDDEECEIFMTNYQQVAISSEDEASIEAIRTGQVLAEIE